MQYDKFYKYVKFTDETILQLFITWTLVIKVLAVTQGDNMTDKMFCSYHTKDRKNSFISVPAIMIQIWEALWNPDKAPGKFKNIWKH